MFVDGDDYVELDFCEKPHRVAVDNNADVVIFQKCLVNSVGRELRKSTNEYPCLSTTKIVDPETALYYGGTAVLNKLYNRELFKTIVSVTAIRVIP